ncbi:hypothetical protein [Pontibacter vulgaris]|uniref:hypothetical protein n=1 Tax=Pontibacter vulgaris TaxID=2905679 RepID=UPI001FA7D0F5|nr:hypothetical protein [Pontibacter vulgaris]
MAATSRLWFGRFCYYCSKYTFVVVYSGFLLLRHSKPVFGAENLHHFILTAHFLKPGRQSIGW